LEVFLHPIRLVVFWRFGVVFEHRRRG
jgi:hypothetical protein